MAWLEFHCRHRYASGFELDARFDSSDGVTALVGPSGSGKSTILACIAGVLRPAFGRITVGGVALTDTEKKVFVPPEQRGIGVVFQERLLFPHLSVQQNLEYGMQRRPQHAVQFARLVEVLEMRELLPRFPDTLSGGERQRVALGRAILRGPRLLLLDEPLTALDAALRARITEYIQRVISEFRLPALLISHDASDVASLAETVLHFCAGRRVDS